MVYLKIRSYTITLNEPCNPLSQNVIIFYHILGNLSYEKKCSKMLQYLNKNNFKLVFGSFPGNGIFKNKKFNYNH